MSLDPQIQALIDALLAAGGKPVHLMTPAEARRVNEEHAAELFGPVEEVAGVEDRTIPGPAGEIPVRIYRPDAPAPQPILVYFHGGGWVVGSLDTHDGPCRSLANRAGCTVVAVDYRTAPEHRFPAAVEDAWTALEWAAAQDPPGLAVGGDSSGGNLAAVMALRARDRGSPPLNLQLLVYPVTDCDLDTASYRACADGYVLTRDGMRWYWNQYLPEEAARMNSEASPLRAESLEGVAPAVILTCEFDPLRDEGEAYAQRLAEAGVQVICRRYDGA